MHEGMAYIELYNNAECTRKIPKDSNGNYTLITGKVSKSVSSPYIHNIYGKNIGTHKAYDVKVTSISPINAVDYIDTEMLPQEIITIPIKFYIQDSSVKLNDVLIKVEYDSI